MINIQEQLQKYWFLNWNKFWDQDWINNPLHLKHFPHVYRWMTINGVLFKTYCIHLDQWVCIVINTHTLSFIQNLLHPKRPTCPYYCQHQLIVFYLTYTIFCIHEFVSQFYINYLSFIGTYNIHCNQWVSYNSTPINWVLLEPTASIKTDESVSSAHVKLNFGVCQKFRPMEGQGHIAQLDIPTVWVR